MIDKRKIILPSLRGKMGDWFYYVTLMPFKEIAQRVSMADEIHKNEGLNRLIQREVGNRIKGIVEYLRKQEQRFFNALILGLYGGKPAWQEIVIKEDESNKFLEEKDIIYFNKTFGLLTLSGDEKIFAIDGQHRTRAIKDVLIGISELEKEEITVIFIAHKTDREGEIRTRRLFSTLNRYAKPVSLSEIIALDEDDNCAIITRNLVDYFDLFTGKILFNKNRSINPKNTTAFTNIMILYDIVVIHSTDKPVMGIKIQGKTRKEFTSVRASEEIINETQKYIQDLFCELIEKLPSLNKFFNNGKVNRENKNTSLLFRPIGQNIFFSVLKVGIEYNFKEKVIEYFAQETFNLNNKVWKDIFWDKDLERIKPEKSLQRYAINLILKRFGFEFKETKKDKEVFDSFGIDPKDI